MESDWEGRDSASPSLTRRLLNISPLWVVVIVVVVEESEKEEASSAAAAVAVCDRRRLRRRLRLRMTLLLLILSLSLRKLGYLYPRYTCFVSSISSYLHETMTNTCGYPMRPLQRSALKGSMNSAWTGASMMFWVRGHCIFRTSAPLEEMPP